MEFLVSLIFPIVGTLISLIIIGLVSSVTVMTAGVGYWIPALIGLLICIVINGGDLFDIF